MFVEPTTAVYEGMIVAENARDNDMTVNPTTAKQLTNMRTTSSDENIILKPARKMTLEQALEYIEEDELIEVTPAAVRLRKRALDATERKKAARAASRARIPRRANRRKAVGESGLPCRIGGGPTRPATDRGF